MIALSSLNILCLWSALMELFKLRTLVAARILPQTFVMLGKTICVQMVTKRKMLDSLLIQLMTVLRFKLQKFVQHMEPRYALMVITV